MTAERLHHQNQRKKKKMVPKKKLEGAGYGKEGVRVSIFPQQRELLEKKGHGGESVDATRERFCRFKQVSEGVLFHPRGRRPTTRKQGSQEKNTARKDHPPDGRFGGGPGTGAPEPNRRIKGRKSLKKKMLSSGKRKGR